MSSGNHYQPPPGPPPSHQQYGQQQQPQQQQSQNPFVQNQSYTDPSTPYPQQQVPHQPPRQPQNPSSTGPAEPLLPQGQDRAEQVEYMQSYEASAARTEDDDNQATLQREFPGVDGSLIAALYSDSKSLGATREMLQALSETT